MSLFWFTNDGDNEFSNDGAQDGDEISSISILFFGKVLLDFTNMLFFSIVKSSIVTFSTCSVDIDGIKELIIDGVNDGNDDGNDDACNDGDNEDIDDGDIDRDSVMIVTLCAKTNVDDTSLGGNIVDVFIFVGASVSPISLILLLLLVGLSV